jgi:hypothetical protein
MSTIDIKNMDVQERLKTMEVLWNSLLNEDPEIDSPQWHQDILTERKSKIKTGKSEYVSLKDLKAGRDS